MNFEFGKAGENVRHEEGHVKGGRICGDQRVVLKSRSAGKEIIKDIGKKILTGSFNLTKVSFPIRVMIPKTALETAVHASILISIIIYNKPPFSHFIFRRLHTPLILWRDLN